MPLLTGWEFVYMIIALFHALITPEFKEVGKRIVRASRVIPYFRNGAGAV